MNRFPELVSLKKGQLYYLTNENNYLRFSKKNYRLVFFLKRIQTEGPFLNFLCLFSFLFFTLSLNQGANCYLTLSLLLLPQLQSLASICPPLREIH